MTTLARTAPSAHEQRLALHGEATGGLSQVLAAASSRVRAERSTGDARHDALVEVAAGVAAPLLVGYVLWVLDRARADGLASLHFLARDGQVLARVARVLAARLGRDLDVRYLHASRRANNLAATVDIGPEDLEWMLRHATGQPVEAVLQRVDLEVGDLGGVGPGTVVTPQLHGDLARSLGGDLREAVLHRARLRRPLVGDYLRQEAFFDERPAGIVDLGGYGSQVRALHALRRQAGLSAPRAYLMGLEAHRDPAMRSAVLASAWLADTECWLFDDLRGGVSTRVRGLVTFAQTACAADHGTTVDYALDGDRVRPVLDPAVDDELRLWGVGVVQDTVVAVAEAVDLDVVRRESGADLRAAVAEVVSCLWRDPAPAAAAAWGSFPFEDGGFATKGRRPLARPYSLRQVTVGALRRTFPDLSWTHWHEAAVAQSPAHVQATVRLLTRAYRWQRAAKQRITSKGPP